jgi:CIC family chloride channel protein
MKAPLTSIFLIAELSNGYSLFIPLMIVTCVAYVIGYYFEPSSIYTKKLEKTGDIITHNKDRSVLVFLNLTELLDTDFNEMPIDSTLGDAVKVVACAHRNTFPVVDDDGRLCGVVQLDDMRVDMFDQSKYRTPIESYMAPPPDTILQHEQVQSVLDKFEQTKAWVLPVVDRTGKYLGFVSKSRILAAYRQQLVEISEA